MSKLKEKVDELIFKEDQQINISFGAVIFLIFLATSAGIWMNAIQAEIANSTERLDKQEISNVIINKALGSIDSRLSRIEGMLEEMNRTKR